MSTSIFSPSTSIPENLRDGNESQYKDTNKIDFIALAVYTAVCLSYTLNLYTQGLPCFALYPTMFSFLGGFIDILWEIIGQPSCWLPAVQSIRKANSSLVLGFTAYITIVTSSLWMEGAATVNQLFLRLAFWFCSGWLVTYSWIGKEMWRVSVAVPMGLLQLIWLNMYKVNFRIGRLKARYFLRFLQLSLVAFVARPAHSAGIRHVSHLSILLMSMHFLYRGMQGYNFSNTSLGPVPFGQCEMLTSSSLMKLFLAPQINWVMMIGTVLGGTIAVMSSKLAYYTFRNRLLALVWARLLSRILSTAGPYPFPVPRSGADNKNLFLKCYQSVNSHAAPLNVPASADVPLAQRGKYAVLRLTFRFLDWADLNIPVAVVNELPRNKPRLDPCLGLEHFWNSKLLHAPIPKAPLEMKERFSQGELLSYILLFCNGFRDVREPTSVEIYTVRMETGKTPNRVMDYTKYERFEHRDGYSPYGGKAFFQALNIDGYPCSQDNEEIHDITLLGVVSPKDPSETIVKRMVKARDGEEDDISSIPGHAHFDYIQRSIHATSLFVATALHHFFEIHAVTSMTSVALNNAFDKEGKPHPFRALMQLHHYASTEVFTVTSPHLVNRNATFSQIFALKAPEIARSINDHFNNYEYLSDCNFHARRRLMNTPQFRIEQAYMQVYKEYAVRCVRLCWGDFRNEGDFSELEKRRITQRITQDTRMTTFLNEITQQMASKRIPERFAPSGRASGAQGWSADGVAQFIAETIHLHTVRHEYLGTKTMLPALDFNVSGLTVQYTDARPPPEDDFRALVMMVAATGLQQFPSLMKTKKFNTPEKVKESIDQYLGAGSPDAEGLFKAFKAMADTEGTGLMQLQADWEGDSDVVNENILRVLPEEVHITAGS